MFDEKVWKSGEVQTVAYMKKLGYKIITTNFSGKGFELDVVALLKKRLLIKKLRVEFKHKLRQCSKYEELNALRKEFQCQKKQLRPLLIVVEVKTRTNNKFGKGFDAVSATKQEKLVLGAKWLLKQKKYRNYNVRFDVSSIDSGKLTYIEGAFETKNQ